jgi:hypothetical protein
MTATNLQPHFKLTTGLHERGGKISAVGKSKTNI